MTTILAMDPIEHVVSHPMFGDHMTWFTNQSFMAFVAGLLDFPDVGAEIGEQQRGERPLLKAGEIEHRDALERSGHGSESFLRASDQIPT